MKKIMMAVAIVCVAALSQAATVDWSINSSFLDAGWTPVQGVLTVTDITTANAYALTLDSDGNAIGNATITEGGSVTWSLAISNFDEGGTWSKDYNFTFTNPYPGMADLEGSLSAYADDAVVSLTGDGSLDLTASAAGQGYTAVPEPTSGLLILLGMAGLALKRKVA